MNIQNHLIFKIDKLYKILMDKYKLSNKINASIFDDKVPINERFSLDTNILGKIFEQHGNLSVGDLSKIGVVTIVNKNGAFFYNIRVTYGLLSSAETNMLIPKNDTFKLFIPMFKYKYGKVFMINFNDKLPTTVLNKQYYQ